MVVEWVQGRDLRPGLSPWDSVWVIRSVHSRNLPICKEGKIADSPEEPTRSQNTILESIGFLLSLPLPATARLDVRALNAIGSTPRTTRSSGCKLAADLEISRPVTLPITLEVATAASDASNWDTGSRCRGIRRVARRANKGCIPIWGCYQGIWRLGVVVHEGSRGRTVNAPPRSIACGGHRQLSRGNVRSHGTWCGFEFRADGIDEMGISEVGLIGEQGERYLTRHVSTIDARRAWLGVLCGTCTPTPTCNTTSLIALSSRISPPPSHTALHSSSTSFIASFAADSFTVPVTATCATCQPLPDHTSSPRGRRAKCCKFSLKL